MMHFRSFTLAAAFALVLAPAGASSRLHTDISHPVATAPVTVQVVAGAGTVTSEPAGIDCGSACTAQLPVGSQVILTAVPGPGGSVHAWGGACVGSATTCVLTVANAATVTVSFDPVHLTVTVQGSGGWITSSGVDSPDGIDCGVGSTCTASFPIGTTLTLYAIRSEDGALDSWGNCPFASSVLCNITLASDTAVTATFSQAALQIPVSIETDVDVSPSGAGSGEIAISPAGGAHCTSHCVKRYPVGVRIHLTASPGGSSVFGGWTGACGGASGAVCSLGVVPGLSIGAVFQPATAPAPPTDPPPTGGGGGSGGGSAGGGSGSGGSGNGVPGGGGTGGGGGVTVPTQPATPRIALHVHVGTVRANGLRALNVLLEASRSAVARITVHGPDAPPLRKDAAVERGGNRVVLAVPRARPPGRQRVTIALRDADGNVQTVTAVVRLR
jgi:hypothetical protein